MWVYSDTQERLEVEEIGDAPSFPNFPSDIQCTRNEQRFQLFTAWVSLITSSLTLGQA